MDAIYVYQPLKHEDSIRILQLQPASLDGDLTLRCELLEKRLSKEPEYEAISYVWGEPVFPEAIVLSEGRHLNITSSLAAALRRFRPQPGDEPRSLWADAVCINQADTAEKSRQVANMGAVFRTARRVLAWLGAGDDRVVNGVGCLQEIAAYAGRLGIADIADAFTATVIRPHTAQSAAQGAAIGEHVSTMDIAAICSFLALPWARRVWIVQEFALANDVVFHYGETKVLRAELMVALSMIYYFPKTTAGILLKLKSNMITMAGGHFHDIILGPLSAMLRESSRFGTSIADSSADHMESRARKISKVSTILSYLKQPGRECSDPRDYVYAFIGLNDNSDFAFVPDYGKSVEEIYVDFAATCLRCKDLKILEYAGISLEATTGDTSLGPEENGHRLPSWAPDWRPGKQLERKLPINAGQPYWGLDPCVRVIENNTVLRLQGILIDIVKVIRSLDVPAPAQSLISDLEAWQTFLTEVKAMYQCHAGGSATYFTGEDRDLVIKRTLTLDRRIDEIHGALARSGGGTRSADNVLWFIEHVPWAELSLDSEPGLTRGDCSRDSADGVENPGGSLSVFLDIIRSWLAKITNSADGVVDPGAWLSTFLDVLRSWLARNTFCVTRNGYVGLGRGTLRDGDCIAILAGAGVPFALRPVDGTEYFRLVGPCYLHGFMRRRNMDETRSEHWRECMESSPATFDII